MKKHLLMPFICCLLVHLTASSESDLGKETIEPLRFPKFTISGEYAVLRKMRAFNGSDFKRSPNNAVGLDLHAEAGLLKNLNAGFSLSFTKSDPFLLGTNIFRMGLFLKPYLPIGNYISVFSRLGLGPSASIGTEASAYKLLIGMGGDGAPPEGLKEFFHSYGTTTYWPFAAGFNGSATLGIEVFFSSRVALFAETGIRADMLWAKKAKASAYTKFDDKPASGNPSPNWFHYVIYDMPIIAGVHVIL